MPANTSNSQQEANFLEDDDTGSNEEVNPTILESHEQDTGVHHNSPPDCQNQPQVVLDTTQKKKN